MDIEIAVLLSVALGYALGSIPWAYLVSRKSGVDIEAMDAGIAGTANVYRNVGHVQGLVVLAGDLGKGAAAVVFAHQLGAEGNLALLTLLACLVGHAYPLFGRFPGGVGLATLGGGAAALGGLIGLAALVIGVLMVAILRNTGNGGGVGFAAFVILGVAFGVDQSTIAGVVALGAAVLIFSKLRYRIHDATRSQRL